VSSQTSVATHRFRRRASQKISGIAVQISEQCRRLHPVTFKLYHGPQCPLLLMTHKIDGGDSYRGLQERWRQLFLTNASNAASSRGPQTPIRMHLDHRSLTQPNPNPSGTRNNVVYLLFGNSYYPYFLSNKQYFLFREFSYM
jgi:hypothetical protein